ncbi:DMT family transporter [Sulfitobacter sp. HNIBRBA2951]|uniref:DMT family transporter n=1 Tax=Sulfitobacter aquimarinus TaxID=3158557 RepID=UPI0032DFC95A
MTHYAIIMVLAGIGIPVLAALNAQLGGRIGSPAAAACVLFVVALASAFVVAMIHAPQGFAKLLTAPKYLFFGGVLIAFYLLSITFIAPHFGIGNAVFFVLLGQLFSAALIDHFGLFGAQLSPVSLTRAAGIGVMAFGVWLTQQG